ncbi:hypothetical protein SBA3_3790004 [Candidatus Sulfopaludibacter sp. SbA3]|nr:hypothetical protein SBA3_3790004 [Candidatus Sulfopaludibacter sp. SbA3]
MATPAVLPPVRRAKRAAAQPRPLTPGPWPRFFDPVNEGRTAPQNVMKNRRWATPAILFPHTTPGRN